MLGNPECFTPLFINEERPLDFEALRCMYKINWSEAGSNFRAAEDDTVYAFESFLLECEGEWI